MTRWCILHPRVATWWCILHPRVVTRCCILHSRVATRWCILHPRVATWWCKIHRGIKIQDCPLYLIFSREFFKEIVKANNFVKILQNLKSSENTSSEARCHCLMQKNQASKISWHCPINTTHRFTLFSRCLSWRTIHLFKELRIINKDIEKAVLGPFLLQLYIKNVKYIMGLLWNTFMKGTGAWDLQMLDFIMNL